MDSPEQTWIRVLLFGNLRRCTVASENGFLVEDAENGVAAEFETNGPLPILVLGDKILIGQHGFGRNVMIKPRDPYVFYIDNDGYRGYLQLRIQDNALQGINHVPLESYLLGVIGAEMHSYWEPQALKAQAVAARTYCLYIKNRFGRRRRWDVSKNQSHQMYKGLKAETASVHDAVMETAGQVLVCRYGDGRELVFPAYYSSACGGHTEKAQNVFGENGEDLAPLRGVKCPYCKDVTRKSIFQWKPITYTLEQISEQLMERYASLKQLEQIVDLKITRSGHLDRVLRMQLIGKNGRTDWLRGEDFRLALDPTGQKLKSAVFEMEKNGQTVKFTNGRGFGHGVGLCQCGAQGMARRKSSYRDILAYYYPGSKLVTIQTPDTR
jgi:stage II sporulation protein D